MLAEELKKIKEQDGKLNLTNQNYGDLVQADLPIVAAPETVTSLEAFVTNKNIQFL